MRVYKQAVRQQDDISIVNAALQVKLSSHTNGKKVTETERKVEEMCLFYGGMAEITKEAKIVNTKLVGRYVLGRYVLNFFFNSWIGPLAF